MRKRLLVSMFALTSLLISTAHAGEYGNALNNDKMCSALGNIAVSTYKSRNEPGAREKALKGTAPSPSDDSYQAESKRVMYLAQTYALNKAVSPKDAYMKAWAYCMDRGM